jgi:hypothetical protein
MIVSDNCKMFSINNFFVASMLNDRFGLQKLTP